MNFGWKFVLGLAVVLVVALSTQVYSLGWKSKQVCAKRVYERGDHQYVLFQAGPIQLKYWPLNYVCKPYTHAQLEQLLEEQTLTN